jgi:hypothetical protein
MSRAHILLLTCILCVALPVSGCGPDSTDAVVVPPPPAPPPAPAPGTGVIGASGGVVILPTVAELSFPAGSVPAGTSIQIIDVVTPTNDADFTNSEIFTGVKNIAGRSAEVRVQGVQPTLGVNVKIFVPAAYTTNLPSGQNVRVLSLSDNESDLEERTSLYEIINPSVNFSDSSISFIAGPELFSHRTGNNNIARFVVATSE